MVCGKRTMCRVPRCRAETSKHVTCSCDCTKRKVHCWTRKCKPPTQCHKCHACHAKRRRMSPSATTATQNAGGCHEVPHLPRKTKADVTKCHACQAKRRWMSPSATPATQSWAATPATKRAQARHQSQPSAISVTPATQNKGGCHQVPLLPREAKVDVTKPHACHAKYRCRQVLRLPRKDGV